jgi:hypothetical protein
MAASELPYATRWELVPRDMWYLLSCPELGLGSWGNETRGGTRARRRELVPREVWRHPSCPCRVA